MSIKMTITEIDKTPIVAPIVVPKRVFIVPYRDREQHKKDFLKNMKLL